VIAERVRAAAHPVPTPAIPVTPLAASTTRPAAVELLEPARAGAAVGRGETASRRARVAVVDALGGVEVQVRARRWWQRVLCSRDVGGAGGAPGRVLRLCCCERTGAVCGLRGDGVGRRAEDVVYYDVDVPRARRYMVVMEVIVSAHSREY
jgi:hypothetical protein